MKTKYKKDQKGSDNLVIGDKISVGGIVCVVVKVEDIFHYTPMAFIRVELGLVGTKTKKKEIVVFLPFGTQIEILK